MCRYLCYRNHTFSLNCHFEREKSLHMTTWYVLGGAYSVRRLMILIIILLPRRWEALGLKVRNKETFFVNFLLKNKICIKQKTIGVLIKD